MERYIGLDAHTSSCTVAVIGQSGKRLNSQVVETNAKALIEVIRAVPQGPLSLSRGRSPLELALRGTISSRPGDCCGSCERESRAEER
jgi:hypothetical protein